MPLDPRLNIQENVWVTVQEITRVAMPLELHVKHRSYYACFNKLSQTQWLKTMEVYYFTILEARKIQNRCQESSCLFQFVVITSIHHLLVSVCILKFSSKVCSSFSPTPSVS